MIPQFKQGEPTEKTRWYPPQIVSLAPEFTVAADRFCEYAHRLYALPIVHGEGGIVLEKDSARADRYHLECGERIVLKAGSLPSAHWGLASLLQLMEPGQDGFYCQAGVWEDWPDVPYRGLMVDLARQWHPFELLLKYVDLCYVCKVNKLQLHFTDDQSFTLPVSAFPKLSASGRAYTREQIARLAEYAFERGIELIPEVDMPGHCGPFQRAYPELFGDTGVLPAGEEVFDALRTVFQETADLFPHSPCIHVGGDEASVESWGRCERTRQYMNEHGIAGLQHMYAEYIRQITERVLAMGRTPIVWEGFHKEYNHLISKKVLVIAWESYYQPAYDLAEGGFTLINASWKPLYVVTRKRYWPPEEILKWHPWLWQNWWEKSAAYPDGFTLDKESCTVLGGQLCAWGDCLQDYEEPLEGCLDELSLIAQRLPALAEAAWNVKRDRTGFQASYPICRQLIDRLLTDAKRPAAEQKEVPHAL